VNYPSLRYLLEKYGDQGFTVLGAPCNQFGGQAPGTSEEERQAAYSKFGLSTFPVLDKLIVNGPETHPMYRILKSQQPVSLPSSQAAPISRLEETGRLEWNYVKFLVDRNGVARKRFKPAFDPLDFEADVRLLLAGKEPLPGECVSHPGRKVCNVDRLLQEA
jgi:glutathione peroxidase